MLRGRPPVKLCGFDVGLDRPLFLIAGPCVVESLGLQLDVAGKLKEITTALGIPFVFKSSYDKANRSSAASFRGLGRDEGLRILAEVRRQVGVPVLTDVHAEDEIAAAAAVGRLLRLSPGQMQDALGSAGTQSAGLWEFLRDGADSKQLHTAHAAAAGLAAAYLARDGFTGAKRILEGRQGMAAGMSTDADPSRLVDGLGARWTIAETSFKYHASCRHTHPAADALQRAMREHALEARDVKRVVARVHQGAIDVLGPVVDPSTVHQAKFSMGTVLGLIAVDGHAGLAEFDAHYRDPAVVAFRDRVAMELDEEVDRAYPARWIGKVTVETTDGRRLDGRVDEPRGDPGNTLTTAELEDKAIRLARYRDGASEAELRGAITAIRALASTARVPRFLA